MDLLFSEEQQSFARTVEEFAKKEILPGAVKRDETGEWDQQLWQKIAGMGLCGLPLPEEFGGSGAGAVTSLAAYEAFCRGGLDAGIYLSLGAHVFICAVPLYLHGSEEQKLKYLPGLAGGKLIGALGLTEPNAGSDASGLRTTARRDGDGYILNGTKMFITNGPIVDLVLVLAKVDKNEREDGLTALIVERDTPGFLVGQILDKMGHRSSPTAELVFEECRVPVANRVGLEGQGLAVMSDALIWERGVFLAAESIGLMGAMLQIATSYATERQQFNQPIANFQMTREKLADIKVSLDAARMLAYRAAWLLDSGLDCRLESAVAKSFYARELVKTADSALQIFGGYGYMKEYPIERLYRDAKLLPIGGGTTEIQKLIISSRLFKQGGEALRSRSL